MRRLTRSAARRRQVHATLAGLLLWAGIPKRADPQQALQTSPTVSSERPVCAPARTALVLAGGGAKGAAHIGVIKVLDSLGIHPDFVVGTSRIVAVESELDRKLILKRGFCCLVYRLDGRDPCSTCPLQSRVAGERRAPACHAR